MTTTSTIGNTPVPVVTTMRRYPSLGGATSDRALAVWMTVGESPFTADLAAKILGAVEGADHLTGRNMAGQMRTWKNAKVIEDIEGNRRAYYRKLRGPTQWRFTSGFRTWAREVTD